MVRRALLAAVVSVLWLDAGPATAAPPPNDSPAGAGVFAPYSAPNGVPTQQEALADLAEAGPDAGVPRCLLGGSFARTVWYRVPESASGRLMTFEASGRTTDPIDLAAYVQPYVQPPPPTPPPPPYTPPPVRRQTNLFEPNACDGVGAGAGADAADRSSAVSLLVPAGYPVLVQVGRRGPVGAPLDEAAVVALEAVDIALARSPRGDVASRAPRLGRGSSRLDLAGATITGEDPAQPACPALATVWRKVVPGSSGRRLVSVYGNDASSLTVFEGRRPTGDNAVDCVVRRTGGPLQMVVSAERRRPLWIRVGSDSFVGDETARIRVSDGTNSTIVNGGSGGFDPTPGGPAGGLPGACDSADVTRARVSGPDLRGRAGTYNRFVRVPVRIRVTGSAICDATLRLIGPGGSVYAQGRFRALRRSTSLRTVVLPRFRTFRAGRYRLEATGVDLRGRRARAESIALSGRLTRGNG